MSSQVSVINSLAADPQFLKLSDDEKKFILSKASGAKPQPQWDPSKVDIQPGAQGTYDRSDIDKAIDIGRPIVSNTVGGIAGAAAAPSAAFTGPVGPLAARTGAYTLTDAALQYLKSQKPESVGSALAEGGKQAISNELLGGLFKRLGAVGKAFYNADQPEIFNFSPTTSQALKATGSSSLLSGPAKIIEDISLNAKQKALDRAAGAGFTQALQAAKGAGFDRDVNGRYMFSMNPQTMLNKVNAISPGADFSVLDNTIADPKKLQDTLTAAQANGIGENLKRSLQGYQFQKMFNEATTQSLERGSPATGNVVRIDPQKLANQWLDPEMQNSFKTLYNSSQRAEITRFFKNIAYTQDKVTNFPIAKPLWLMHGGIGMATGFFTGSIPEGAAVSLGTFVSAEVLGRALTNPKTARYMVALAGGEPLGVSEAFAARQIANVLQGYTVAAINSDGSLTPMVVKKP